MKFHDGLAEFNYRIYELPHDDVTERRISALEDVQDNNLHSLAVELHKRFPHWNLPHCKNARRFCRLIFARLNYREEPIQSSMSHWDRMANIMMCSRYKNPFAYSEKHPWSRPFFRRGLN